MSRSYREPWIKEKNKKFFKNYANRVIRRSDDELADGRAYKKIGYTYDISDYCFKMRDDEEEPWKYKRK